MSSVTRLLVLLCATAAFFTGATALLGYLLEAPLLYAPLPTAVGMAPNTAAGFCLLAVALWCIVESLPRR